MSRSNRIPLAVCSGTTFLVCGFWMLKRPVEFLPDVPAVRLVLVGAGCLTLYLGSHLLRAIRLAVIGVTVHSTSFRTLALLNLSVAPWSMIAPFKLDELIRVNELRSISNSWPRAIMTLIIDRSMDGPVLLAFAIFLYTHGEPALALYAGFFGVALAAVTIGFFAAAQTLQLLQRYMFLYHYQPRALQTLRIVHQLRMLARLGQETIVSAAPILILCTLGIWFLEVIAVGLLLWTCLPDQASIHSILSATLVRANSGWRALLMGEQLGFPAALISKIFMTGLLLIWPPAIYFYCKRRLSEVRDAQFIDRQLGVSASRRRV